LEELCKVEGIEWIRLHYAYPAYFPDEVIEVMAREPKICKYLDIPFQHISDSQLRGMKRRHTRAEAEQLIAKLRQAIPDIAIRTTLLVGYPNETEEDYQQLVEFVATTRFERMGVFPYCEEEGTFSATLEDNIPEETKNGRAERLMNIQSEISLQLNQQRVGSELRVIIDSLEGDYFIARSEYDSPEVDQEILIDGECCELEIGSFYNVVIIKAEEFDLYAELSTNN
ncbi:MAG: radical SAM protein, partial [Rikenellaceae bacterium]